MENKEVKKEETVETIEQKDNKIKHYDYGHLVIYCGKCNSKYILREDVPKTEAVQITLPPTNTAELRLVCKDCKNEMALFYIESTKKDENVKEDKEIIQEGDTNESIPEESIEEATIV